MGKAFRPSNKEANILSKIESSKTREKKQRLFKINEFVDQISNAVAMKLVEDKLIETTSKKNLETEISKALQTLKNSKDFDIDFKTAPFKHISFEYNIISLYLTACILEDLIDHQDVLDIYGTDEQIYSCINKQVSKYIP